MYQKKGVTKKVAKTEFKVVTKKVVEAKNSCNQKGQVKRKKRDRVTTRIQSRD